MLSGWFLTLLPPRTFCLHTGHNFFHPLERISHTPFLNWVGFLFLSGEGQFVEGLELCLPLASRVPPQCPELVRNESVVSEDYC